MQPANPKNKKAKRKPQIEEDEDYFAPEPIDDSYMESLVPKAIEWSKKAHDSQLRDDGSPYYGHVERVANAVRGQCDTHAYIVALLHDVIEDSEITKEDLAVAFTDDIARDVALLTKLEGMDLETYMKGLVIKYVPFYVKLQDRLDNIKSLPHCNNPEKIKRYTQQTKEIFIPIAKGARYAKLPEFAQVISEIEKHLL